MRTGGAACRLRRTGGAHSERRSSPQQQLHRQCALRSASLRRSNTAKSTPQPVYLRMRAPPRARGPALPHPMSHSSGRQHALQPSPAQPNRCKLDAAGCILLPSLTSSNMGHLASAPQCSPNTACKYLWNFPLS